MHCPQSQSRADPRSRQHVAQKVHPEQNARNRDADGAEQQPGGQARIELDQRHRDRESRDGVSAGERELIVRGFEPASWAMSHRNAVKEFRDTGDISHLKPFEDVSITDVRGHSHDFETRPNVLYRLAASGGEPYEQIYKLLT